MFRISLQSHSTICIFTRSHKKMWVSYVSGTPKISQIGSLIFGITHCTLGLLHMKFSKYSFKLCLSNCKLTVPKSNSHGHQIIHQHVRQRPKQIIKRFKSIYTVPDLYSTELLEISTSHQVQQI